MLENLKNEINSNERQKVNLMMEMGKQNFNELSNLLVAEIQKRDLPPHLIIEFLNYLGQTFRLAHAHKRSQL